MVNCDDRAFNVSLVFWSKIERRLMRETPPLTGENSFNRVLVHLPFLSDNSTAAAYDNATTVSFRVYENPHGIIDDY